MRMYKSLSVVLLCAVMIWYAAAQMREQNNGGPLHGIQVDPMLPTTAAVQENSTLNGRICMTAALRELEENGAPPVPVKRSDLRESGYRHVYPVCGKCLRGAVRLYSGRGRQPLQIRDSGSTDLF